MKYDESEILRVAKISAANMVRTADVYRVITYYPETQTADLEACVKPYQIDMNGEIMKDMYNDYTRMSQNQDAATVLNVPVVQFRCGQFSITAPLEKDDTGLLVFLKNDIDNWREEGGVAGAQHVYPYDYNSCVFIPFVPNESNKDSSFNANSLEIKSKSVIIRVNEETVEITASQTDITSAVNITGDVSVDGNITATGDVTADGISLKNHTHKYEDTQPSGSPVEKSTQKPTE